MTMPDNARPHTSQEQPKISLKNLAGKSCITHHILPIFSSTYRFSSFQELTEPVNGTEAYFKRRGRNEGANLGTYPPFQVALTQPPTFFVNYEWLVHLRCKLHFMQSNFSFLVTKMPILLRLSPIQYFLHTSALFTSSGS
ncbi:hypothetical protein ACTXT7_016487 [Hymenolepis weldensis]